MKKHALGLAALIVSLVALGLAAIPGIALDRPFPLADEESPPEPGLEGGVTLKFENKSEKLSVTFGGKENEKEKIARDKFIAKREQEKNWLLAPCMTPACEPISRWSRSTVGRCLKT